MEAFKISVEVSVNLSESTQKFVRDLFLGSCNSVLAATPAPKAEAPKAEAPKAEAPKAEAPKAEAPKAEAPKAEAPKAEAPKAEAPKAEAIKKLDIEDLRAELKNKVNAHREAIKEKLTALGAPSVTKLAEAKYEEMYNFLINLPNE